MTQSALLVDTNDVKIDFHVSSQSPLSTTVLSMDELKVETGSLHLFLNADAVKILYKLLRDDYTTMSALSSLPDPLPAID